MKKYVIESNSSGLIGPPVQRYLYADRIYIFDGQVAFLVGRKATPGRNTVVGAISLAHWRVSEVEEDEVDSR